MAALGASVVRGFRVVTKSGRKLLPRATSSARALGSHLKRPTLTGAKLAGIGIGAGVGVHAVRTALVKPSTQSFGSALLAGVEPDAIDLQNRLDEETAASQHRQRQYDVPTAPEFFTSTTFLVLATAAAIALVVLMRKRGR
jgi:hypothetical protein